jgi:hypothetical protein
LPQSKTEENAVAALKALGGVLSGLAHEFNNRLGSILLNADVLASCSGAKEIASDIARSAEALCEVVRGIELLLGGAEPNPPLWKIQHLVERFARGYLSQRHVDFSFARAEERIRIPKSPASVFLALLLALSVFSRKPDDGRGRIAVAFSEEGGKTRKWRMESDTPVERDGAAFAALEKLCASEEWILSSGDGWLSIDAKVEA